MRPSLLHLADLTLPAPAPQVRESVLDASEELDNLTNLALKNLRHVLEEPYDTASPKAVRAKIAAAGQVLNTQVRVDEGRLKRRQMDTLPKLLDLIRQAEGRPMLQKMIEGSLAD